MLSVVRPVEGFKNHTRSVDIVFHGALRLMLDPQACRALRTAVKHVKIFQIKACWMHQLLIMPHAT